MYLKKLEINGFKSFADQTELDMDPGVTVIVGPNGCGKSNVSDSLRWVLGEQNARNLRGLRMGDMIFNGTVNRPPEGMAEVSLVFDNEDGLLPISFTEVKVTRRLFRDGSSDYLINNARCRLRDITNIFLGSGIGVSSYSLMEQGQVDMIVNAKPQQRRALIEEAAGVSRYLKRRSEALRKLERTEADLCRLEDILQELERQARSLKRQAGQTARVREYRRSLDILERIHEVRHGKALRGQSESVDTRLEEFRERLDEIRKDLETVRDAKRGHVEDLERVDTLNRERRDRYVSVTGLIEQGERNIENLTLRREEYEQHCVRLDNERQDAKQQLRTEHTELEQTENNLERIKGELVHFFEYLERLEGEFGEIESRLLQVQEEGQQKRRNLNDLEKDLGRAETDAREWERDRTFFSQRRAQTAQDASTLEVDLKHHQINLQKHNSAYVEAKQALRGTSRRADDLQNQLRDVQQRQAFAASSLKTVERDWHRSESRLESLVELQRDLEGFGSGVRFLMRHESGPREGLRTTLAEVLRVDPGYEVAIDAALDMRLQGIVASDTHAVWNALAALKESGEGRVAFLVEGTGHGRAPESLPESLQELERASERVQAEPGHESTVERLLERTLIASDLDRALEVWRDLPSGWQIVTPEGETLNGDGTLVGGPASHAGLLFRTTEIGELRTSLKSLDRRRGALADQAEFLLDRVRDLNRQREEASRQVVRLEGLMRSSQGEVSRIREQTSRLEDHLGTLLGEQMELDRELEEGAGKDAARVEDIQRLRERRTALEAEVEEWNRVIATLTERRREVHEGITTASMQRLEREKDQERWRSEIRTRTQRIEELQTRVEKNTELIAEQEERATQVETAVVEQKALLVEQRQEQAGFMAEIEEGERAAEEVKAHIRAVQNEEERLVSRTETVDGERTQVDQERVRLTVELEYWERRMVELFGEGERPADIEDERGDEEIAEEIALLRGRVERIGVVNELAVEEYDDVKVRLDAMIEQRDDLMKARSDLLHTVRELHDTTIGLFTKTFEEVQENFKAMVRKMFNGGRAELRLQEDLDPMAAGIEIEVQPPGKKLTNISLLSGGEKALVAIALMFAIYKTKPSPFCFMDEIDAPLDDTNIGRFTTLLESFLDSSQFIIISHNKKTMEIADTLYGVTMQEEGVSTLMSMQFESRADRREALDRRAKLFQRRVEEETAEGRQLIDVDQLGRTDADDSGDDDGESAKNGNGNGNGNGHTVAEEAVETV